MAIHAEQSTETSEAAETATEISFSFFNFVNFVKSLNPLLKPFLIRYRALLRLKRKIILWTKLYFLCVWIVLAIQAERSTETSEAAEIRNSKIEPASVFSVLVKSSEVAEIF